MAYQIEIVETAIQELREIESYYRKAILYAITHQLVHEPDSITRNRKPLENLLAGFSHTPPIWELRVGEFRVFYDLTTTPAVVTVRAVRRKRPGQQTKEIAQ